MDSTSAKLVARGIPVVAMLTRSQCVSLQIPTACPPLSQLKSCDQLKGVSSDCVEFPWARMSPAVLTLACSIGDGVGDRALAGGYVARGGRIVTLANFIASFGIVIFFAVIALLDWLGQRKDRRTNERRI